jgi:hypothetical protein
MSKAGPERAEGSSSQASRENMKPQSGNLVGQAIEPAISPNYSAEPSI